MGTLNAITGEISSAYTLITHEEVFDDKGIIKTEVLPTSVIGTQITVSPTPPSNPQPGDLWINTNV
jgi:hypothetical protein